jgi:hypothetical protein
MSLGSSIAGVWDALHKGDDWLQHQGSPSDALQAVGGAIGATWHAASNSSFAGFLGNALQDVNNVKNNGFGPSIGDQNIGQILGNAVGGSPMGLALAPDGGPAAQARDVGSKALQVPYSYAVARPISTLFQVDEAGGYLSHSAWNQAWNRSETISPGQAIAVDAMTLAGQGQQFGGDPFSDANTAVRDKTFHDSWAGKLASGSIDAVLGFTVDPLVVAGKGSKVLDEASNVVDVADRAAVLDRAKNPALDLASQQTPVPLDPLHPISSGGKRLAQKTLANPNSQGDKLNKLADRIVDTPVGQIPAMPELRGPDAGALAVLMQRAKETAASREDARNGVIDVIGASWGDKSRLDQLVTQRGQLALEMERLSTAPALTAQIAQGSSPEDALRIIKENQDDIDRHIAAVNDVLDLKGTSERRVQANALDSRNYNATKARLNTTFKHNGIAGPTIRMTTAQLSNRLPRSVNLKDMGAGYRDMQDLLGQSFHLSTQQRSDFLDSFVKASNADGRQSVVRAVNEANVKAIGQQYGLNPSQLNEIIRNGDESVNYIRTSLSERLYSATDQQGFVAINDEDVDHIDAISKPLLKTQIEDTHPILDPKALDRTMKSVTRSRLMDNAKYITVDGKIKQVDNLGNVVETARLLGDEGMRQLMSRWKDAALMRGAYPLRVMTDSFLRLAIHLDTLTYLGTRIQGAKGVTHYLLTQQDGAGKSVRNMFKEGDQEGALGYVLKGHVGDARFDLSDDDVAVLNRIWQDNPPDLAQVANDINNLKIQKVRDQDWRLLHPPKEGQDSLQGFADYIGGLQRVLNQQIGGSPVARELIWKDEDEVAKDVRDQLVKGGPLADEYREVGRNYPSMEEWLIKSKEMVDHYLPTPGMRNVFRTPEYLPVGRVDLEGADFKLGSKPHGLFFHVHGRQPAGEPDVNPHLPAVEAEGQATGKNVVEKRGHSLNLHSPHVYKAKGMRMDLSGLRQGAPQGVKINVDPGVEYFRDKVGQRVFDMRVMVAKKNPDAFTARLEKDFPDVDWSKYDDPLAQMGAVGALMARRDGYRALYQPESWGGANDAEYVGLTPSSVTDELPPDKKELFSKDMLQSMLFGKEASVTPMDVHGQMYHVRDQGEISKWVEEKRGNFYRMVADMPETVLARAPIFWASYRDNIAHQLEAIPEEYMDERTITMMRRNAMTQAHKQVRKTLFNASDSSNLAHSMRYISPFFAAWEDTMKKYSTLLYDNPEYLPRMMQAMGGLNDAGMVVDSNGNRVNSFGQTFDSDGHLITDPNYDGTDQYVLLPRKLTNHIPVIGKLQGQGQLKIRKDSINSVFQGQPWWLPGFGPVVQVPANKVVRDMFPKEADDPIMKYVLPYGTTTDSGVTQLLPKWVRTAQSSFGKTSQYNQQYGIFLAQATIDNDHVPLNGKQLAQVANKTRNYFILKAVVDNASPVSVVPDPKYQLYIDKAHEYRADPKRADWQADFVNDFPKFYEMSISLSANETGIQATNAAQDATIKYRNDIRKNPELGWMFVGPSNAGPFSGGVYDWQATHQAGLGQNFRGKKDPTQAVNDVQAEAGWVKWNSFKTAVNLELQRRGLMTTQQKGAEDLAYATQQYRQVLGEQNPAWSDAQTGYELGGAGKMIDAAESFIADHPSVRNRSDMVAMQKYLDLRLAVKQELARRDNKSLTYNPDLQFALKAYGKQLADSDIGFEQMYNRGLEYDDLSDMKINPDGSVSASAST